MRVLQIGLSNELGGIESFAMTYLRSMKEQGIAFDFVDIYGSGLACSEEIVKLGGKIHTLQNFKKHPISAKRRLKEILISEGYRCVHIHMLSAANLLPLQACIEAGITPIVHSHNTKTDGLVRNVMHAMNIPGFRRANAVRLACGKEAGAWMHGGHDFTVIPNAVDIPAFTYDENSRKMLRQQLQIPQEKVVLGFVGRLMPAKNPLFLLDILEELKKEHPDRYLLLLIGNGWMDASIRQEADRRGLTADVILTGKQTNVGQWLSAMDVFLLPSLFEGLAISGVEAQCSGLPSYFSDRITKELAITDLASFLDIANGPQPWAKAISECNVDPAGRAAYARQMEQTQYSIVRSVERLSGIYRRFEET